MKKLSVKGRITLWLTALVAMLTVVLVAMSLFVSSSVANQGAMEKLSATIKNNIKYIEFENGTPVMDTGFSYYHNGVTALIYSKNGSLIAGQIPVNFSIAQGFENGAIRTVESSGEKFVVIDIWLPSDWENGVWVRGITDAPDNDYMRYYLTHVAAITMPLFTILAALGSYFIIKYSFKPLEKITETAEAINEAKDLSGRINLPHGNDEFSRLAENFDNMFERLERSFEAEKQFTSDASHELRTPIAVIKSACEYAEKYDETAEDHKETVAVIRRQADKMAVLIQQLLSMTRMEQGTQKVNFEQLDASDFIKSVVSEQLWDKERLVLDLQQNIIINADRELLSRLVCNLVDNAFKYGSQNGMVCITAQQQNDKVLISVKDEGKGIAPEHREKIWKRFYQVDSSRNDEQNAGAGLGLSIVKQIAQLHGGYMTLQTEQDKGCIFTLHLPAVK